MNLAQRSRNQAGTPEGLQVESALTARSSVPSSDRDDGVITAEHEVPSFLLDAATEPATSGERGRQTVSIWLAVALLLSVGALLRGVVQQSWPSQPSSAEAVVLPKPPLPTPPAIEAPKVETVKVAQPVPPLRKAERPALKAPTEHKRPSNADDELAFLRDPESERVSAGSRENVERGEETSAEEQYPEPKHHPTVYLPPPAGTVPVPGVLSPSQITEVVVAHKAALRACVEAQQELDPDLGGKLVMRWSVGLDGQVTDVAVDTRSLENTQVARCISDEITTWTFPRHTARQAPIRFPFTF